MRTRNRPLFLERALTSVLQQTFADWQLVVINDGGDRLALERQLTPWRPRFGARLLVLEHVKDRNTGIAAPLNLGIERTSSEFLAVHDDDDSWEPEFLEETVGFLREPARGSKYAGAVVKTHLIYEKISGDRLEEVRREIYNEWQNRCISLFRLAEGNTFAPISLVFRRSALSVTGPRRDDLGPLEDWYFNLRLCSSFPVALLDRPLAHYRQRIPESSAGTNANFFNSSADWYGQLDIELRNELLRRDLQAGKFGPGLLVNLAGAHGHLFQKIHALGERLRVR